MTLITITKENNDLTESDAQITTGSCNKPEASEETVLVVRENVKRNRRRDDGADCEVTNLLSIFRLNKNCNYH